MILLTLRAILNYLKNKFLISSNILYPKTFAQLQNIFSDSQYNGKNIIIDCIEINEDLRTPLTVSNKHFIIKNLIIDINHSVNTSFETDNVLNNLININNSYIKFINLSFIHEEIKLNAESLIKISDSAVFFETSELMVTMNNESIINKIIIESENSVIQFMLVRSAFQENYINFDNPVIQLTFIKFLSNDIPIQNCNFCCTDVNVSISGSTNSQSCIIDYNVDRIPFGTIYIRECNLRSASSNSKNVETDYMYDLAVVSSYLEGTIHKKTPSVYVTWSLGLVVLKDTIVKHNSKNEYYKALKDFTCSVSPEQDITDENLYSQNICQIEISGSDQTLDTTEFNLTTHSIFGTSLQH